MQVIWKMPENYLHSELTSEIIRTFYKVYNTLGYGFLEKVYQNALIIELERSGIKCSSSFAIDVFYEDIKVGYFVADIVAKNLVIIEVKSVDSIGEEHEAQLLNYLKATKIEVGLIVNFGKKLQFKRKVFSSNYKTN